jgi:hypothetical protein
MISEILSTNRLTGERDGCIIKNSVLSHEIEGVNIEYYSVKGACEIIEPSDPDCCNILLSVNGEALLHSGDEVFEFGSDCIVRIPYNKQYSIKIDKEKEFHFLRLRKFLNDADRKVILSNQDMHSTIYIKAISDCQVYTEDIKSKKSINRMILPEGLVPRLCMGSVETEGPDWVTEHEHPMLDQLFLGRANCICTCYADGEKEMLTENKILHIPPGSKHSVSVADGDKLSYIWIDFFLTLEGQKYMDEQHRMNDK